MIIESYERVCIIKPLHDNSIKENLMNKKIEELEERIEELELALFDTSDSIDNLKSIQYEYETEEKGTISASSSGNHRRWRETRDLRGAIKYSNWSVNIKIKDESGAALKCEYIQVSDCNYSIKQARTVVEKSSISFTTRDKKGWKSIKFKLQVSYKGSVYKWDQIKLG